MTDSKKATAATVTPLRKAVPCPQCERPSQRGTYPFCSKRCADLDLGEWLSGGYTISGSGDEQSSDGE
ncbi:DNA gyrase inhibitor YacG [Pseudahrensia aquimaris]|uniref:DNA gyrase inhibitor YacG n=1 Tax=Pseudahrensia aquimaris TaxID=744461 RepID=A0ABW3FFH0_9HYPH